MASEHGSGGAGRPGGGAPAPTGPINGTCDAVTGLQWGDEGKGKVIDLYAGGYDAVVRYNGGANAGHSVVIGGERFALHLVPSGIFHERSLAVIGPGVVVDPGGLAGELDGLASRGVPTGGLRLSDRAHLVLPWHKEEDAARERMLAGASAEGEHAIGTTKRGIGPAYSDKASRATAVRVGDLRDLRALRAKVERVAPVKRAVLEALGGDASCAEPDAVMELLGPLAERLGPAITDTVYLLHGMLRDGKRVLFEGANAALLDVDHGTYPFVTSSSTTALGIPSGSGVPGSALGEVIGVAKAYCTRVGAGPFPTEEFGPAGERIRERGNEFGTTTGRPRRCGWLDLVALRYTAMVSGATALAVMLLDVLSGFDELKLCVRYRLPSGEETERFVPDAAGLAGVEPVYESVGGWSEEIRGARERGDLPAAARAYVERIERAVELPVKLVSVGPDREESVR